MNVEKTSFGGWDNCFHIFNDSIDAIVTTDVGPRIIYFGLRDGENMFHTIPEDMGKIGGDEWRAYGGHRLWHAPEMKPRSRLLLIWRTPTCHSLMYPGGVSAHCRNGTL